MIRPLRIVRAAAFGRVSRVHSSFPRITAPCLIAFVTSHFAGASRRKHHHIECLFPTTLGSCGDTTIVVTRVLIRADADHLDKPPSTNSLMPATYGSCWHPLQEHDSLRDFVSASHARHCEEASRPAR